MRGINTQTKKIRKKVFEEVARAAYKDGDSAAISHELEEIPYRITPRMCLYTVKVYGGKGL